VAGEVSQQKVFGALGLVKSRRPPMRPPPLGQFSSVSTRTLEI